MTLRVHRADLRQVTVAHRRVRPNPALIEGVNRTVVYRILEWDIAPDLFLAEWPD